MRRSFSAVYAPPTVSISARTIAEDTTNPPAITKHSLILLLLLRLRITTNITLITISTTFALPRSQLDTWLQAAVMRIAEALQVKVAITARAVQLR